MHPPCFALMRPDLELSEQYELAMSDERPPSTARRLMRRLLRSLALLPSDRAGLPETEANESDGIFGRVKKQGYRAMMEKLLERVMPALNEYTLSYVTSDGTAPDWWADAWPDLEQDLRSKLRTKLGVDDDPERKALHQRRLREWPTPMPSQLATWRARILYAVSPAENAPDAIASLALMLLNIIPIMEICNWTQLATFVLIDKGDEYRTLAAWRLNSSPSYRLALNQTDRAWSASVEIVRFIVVNRAYHFLVYGLWSLLQALTAYFNCTLEDIEGAGQPCSSGAPGRAEGYEIQFTFELLRSLLVFGAYLLLSHGCARGGLHQAVGLELRRLGEDASTARILLSEPGLGETSKSRSGRDGVRGGGRSDMIDDDGHGDGSFALQSVSGPARMMRWLLFYDASAFVLAYGVGLANVFLKMVAVDCSKVDCSLFRWRPHQHNPGDQISAIHRAYDYRPRLLKDWRLWMALDFSQTSYSLLLFPYALLSVQALTRYLLLSAGTKATGYDAHGTLCVALTPKERAERAELLAATRIQAIVRGRQRPSKRDKRLEQRRRPVSSMTTPSTTRATDLM